MEGQKYHCPGCGSEVPSNLINFKTREATCPWCGLHVVFPKRHSTASPNAVTAMKEAAENFMDGAFEAAYSYAKNMLTMVTENGAAEFIEHYYLSYVHEPRNSNSISIYFNEMFPFYELEYEEEEYIKKFIKATSRHCADFYKPILKKFFEYDDKEEFVQFMEDFFPYVVGYKGDLTWFDEDTADLLLDITRKYNVPKTWFSLYNALLKNPESPLASGSFFLRTKTNRIYYSFVLKLEEIFKEIRDPALKTKFVTVFAKAKAAYEKGMAQ